MNGYRVVFRREAIRQLEELYDYIAAAGSPENAARYTEAIVAYCEGLTDFPHRGNARDDIRSGLRTVGYRKRAVIAFAVLDETVAILGIFYGGRDHETSSPKSNTNKADAMSNATWDQEAFKASIPTAREKVEFAPRSIEVSPSQRGWESHRPVIELTFNLCKLGYDIKVLLFRFFTDSENRTVWEHHLALEPHEALQTEPKAINRARMEIARPDTASHLNLTRFDATAKSYRQEVKAISKDTDFMNALKMVRNSVAAH